MASINDLKTYDLHEIARLLGLERPAGNRGNYRSPQHEDKNPSLSIFQRHGRWFWTDHSGGDEARGSCVDLVMYVEGCDVSAAVRRLHELLQIPMEKDQPLAPRKDAPRELHEKIAWFAQKEADQARDYLITERGLTEELVDKAIKAGAVGFNTWTSPKVDAGQFGHGGPAVAFIVKSLNPGAVKSVDLRYLDPELNGGTKTQTFGEKAGYPYYLDIQRLRDARTVYVVESAINALSIECCGMPYTAAVAVRAIRALDAIDWTWFHGQQLILCFDNDEPDKKNRCAGQEAAWQLYDILAGKNIAAMLVDQGEWEHNDVNDILQAAGAEELKFALKRLEPWALQGLPGEVKFMKGRSRLYLPSHDYARYWRYRVKEDFTTYVDKVEQDSESGRDNMRFEDVCGFRVASISRVTIASANSVLSGGEDVMPQTLFAVSVQTPRHGPVLQRRVFEDEELHNADKWGKFGPVFKKAVFSRMVNILERSSDLGSREAINFVGLGWLNNRLMVNEGHHCYFTDPDQQCPYSKLIFPSGTVSDAQRVIQAYHKTFQHSAGLLTLVWALGAHLKALMGFWPHLVMQAAKGSGKSTLCKKLESTIGMTVFGRQSIESAFRVLTSLSHTSHPVGWEEISAGRQEIIDSAVSSLQQAYQYSLTRRGARMLEFLICAPVLLAGEDVPVKSLEGKLVRTDLTDRKGDKLPDNLPLFPVRQWLEFLAGRTREQVNELYQRCLEFCRETSAGKAEDPGANRMRENYAAVLTAWSLLLEFAQLDRRDYPFPADLVEQMNRHIMDTESEREPWVWIMEIILSEIDSNQYRHPYTWDPWQDVDGCLYIRHKDMMNHIQHNTRLREVWNSLTIKSSKVLREHLQRAGVILSDKGDKTINRRRVNHMLVLDPRVMERYGLQPAPTDATGDMYPPP